MREGFCPLKRPEHNPRNPIQEAYAAVRPRANYEIAFWSYEIEQRPFALALTPKSGNLKSRK